LRLEDGRHGADGADGGQKIDVDALMPALIGDIEQGRAGAVACGVDQDIDPAKAGHGGINQPLHIVV
jgi:hypothetical protein